MATKKSAKKALLVSALSLLMCVSLLIGTTFAWFTDSVTVSGNTIQSGTLQVDLIDNAGNSLEGQTLQFVDENGNVLSNILWEPGCTYTLQDVRVKNKGNLAIKYNIVVNGLTGDAKLLEVIDWKVDFEGQENVSLSALKGNLAAGATSGVLKITGHMKEDAGNDYQNLTLAGISITVYATQDTVEADSFDNMYDEAANATMVKDAAELAAAIANGGEVALTEDITITSQLNITSDTVIYGLGKTLTYSGSSRVIDVAKNTHVDLTVKDLTIEINSGYCERGINYNTDGELTLDNVTLTGATKATYGINLPSSSNNATVTIVDSDITAHIALNVWGSDIVINVTNTDISNYDTTEAEDYAAIALNNNGSVCADGTVLNVIGGSITAKNQDGDESTAVRNDTETSVVNISNTTEVIGTMRSAIALIKYKDANGEYGGQFYASFSIQSAVNTAAKSTNSVIILRQDITIDELNVPADVTVDLNGFSLNYTTKTGAGDINVIGQGDLNGSNVVNSAEDLADAFENGGDVVLGGDIDLNDLGNLFNP